ncbi:MAG: EAL domain-containing protein [Huintestinicola sp.]
MIGNKNDSASKKENGVKGIHSSRAISSSIIVIYLIAVAVVTLFMLLVRKIYPDSGEAILATFAANVIGAGIVILISSTCYKQISLRKEKETLEHLMEHINSMVILWDTSFSYIRVNDIFIKTLGYTAEDLKDFENLKKVLPPDAFSENLQAIINNRDEEFIIRSKSGKKVCTVWNTSIMTTVKLGSAESCIMMSIGPDLTETAKMRQELIGYSHKLEESENKYTLSMELSEIGLLLKEADRSDFYASEQLCRMFGLDLPNGYISASELRDLFHPKDRVVFDTFASVMKGGAENTHNEDTHSVEFKALSADGSYHWYQFRYKAVSAAESTKVSIGGAVLDITQEKEKDLIIERMAYIDDVTQIYNRNKFMMMGSEIFDCACGDPNVDYWVIVLDIDSFHIINDTCGYSVGNKLLAQIASIISACLTNGGFAARIGGDNFAILIKADDDNEVPVRLIKRIQEDIASIGGESLETQNITCSAGFCRMSDGDGDFTYVLDRAEFALSLSDGSRSNIVRYDNHAHDAIIAGNEIERELSKAVENHELVLYYQPKISLETGKVMGMEALIRWIKPNGKLVPPSEFIPVAENSMLITKISHFVLHEACRQNKLWQDMGLEPVTVSINLSAIDFYQTNVTEAIREALEQSGLEPQWLDVELTESLALKDIDHAVMQMKEIKNLGVKLSMDDFGTGYSSLSYIQILPISLLKLDRSFIMYLEEDEISREIVSAVIRIAKSKRIETIAEGIETVGQAEILKQSGCDQAQGYFFGKPMPADQFEEFLRSRQSVRV